MRPKRQSQVDLMIATLQEKDRLAYPHIWKRIAVLPKVQRDEIQELFYRAAFQGIVMGAMLPTVAPDVAKEVSLEG